MTSTLLFGFSSLAVLLTSGTIFRLSPLASSLLVFFCLLAIATITVSQIDRSALSRKYFWPLLVFSLLFVFSQLQPQTKPILAEACVLALVALMLSTPTLVTEHKYVRISIIWTLFTFFVLSLAVELSPTAWVFIDWYSRQVSHGFGEFFNLSLQLGPTAMGLSGLALCVVYTWIRISPFLKKSWKRGVTVTLALFCLNHFGTIFFAWLANNITQRKAATLAWNLVTELGLTALDFVPTLFVLQCLVVFVFLDRTIKEIEEPDRKEAEMPLVISRTTTIKFATLWFLLVCISYLTSQWPSGDYNGRITLYQGGMSSWSKPNFEQQGASNRPGLFCVLADYLKSFGFDVKLTKEISSSILADTDAFVVMNFNDKWEKDDYALLNDYIKKGGTLMAFADHTDMAGLMKRTNDLLADTPIRVNFDSAHFLNNYWHYAFVTRLHPVNRKNWDKDNIGISVGASLRLLNHKATPVLIARYAYSDRGNRNDALSKNYIGDRIYNTNEALGDIVLAAESQIGDGKVIVFGDTALLQMGSLVYSQRYVADLFRWAVHGESLSFPWGLLLVLVLTYTWWAAKSRKKSFGFVVSIVISSALAIIASESILSSFYGDHEYNGRIAYVNHAHASLCDHDGFSKDDGDSYLVDNLVRNGYIPMAWKKFNRKALQKSALMISMAAAKPYSQEECHVLDEFMKNGGQLLLLSADRCTHATKDFLKSYGIEILPTPLGAIAPENNSEQIQMYNVNPLSVDGLQQGEIRCTAFEKEYTVAVERQVGEGKLTMIGDCGLFFNGWLEKRDWSSPANINFLQKLIGKSHENQ